jgi:hypothetical protein
MLIATADIGKPGLQPHCQCFAALRNVLLNVTQLYSFYGQILAAFEDKHKNRATPSCAGCICKELLTSGERLTQETFHPVSLNCVVSTT